jgi:hypothetical protein
MKRVEWRRNEQKWRFRACCSRSDRIGFRLQTYPALLRAEEIGSGQARLRALPKGIGSTKWGPLTSDAVTDFKVDLTLLPI